MKIGILAVSFGLIVLTGCGATTSPEPSSSPGAASGAVSSAPSPTATTSPVLTPICRSMEAVIAPLSGAALAFGASDESSDAYTALESGLYFYIVRGSGVGIGLSVDQGRASWSASIRDALVAREAVQSRDDMGYKAAIALVMREAAFALKANC